MAVGTAGNLAWAEDGAALMSEPVEAHKEIGIALNEVPAAEEWNWLLREHGRAVIRRFATTEDLIQARRAGVAGDASEDFGLVDSEGIAPFSWAWRHAGDATEAEICSDGEYLWTMFDAGAGFRIRRRSRVNGAVVGADGVPTYDYPFLATVGGSIYVADDLAGDVKIAAVDRVTLAESYHLDIVAGGTVRAIATDGHHVAVAAGNFLHLLHDSGAALTLVGSYDNGFAVNSVKMDGQFIVIAGDPDGGGDNQIWAMVYTPSIWQPMSRTGAVAVDRIAYNGRSIAFVGPTDGGKYSGYFRGATAALRWEGSVASNDAAIVRGMVVLAGADGYIRFLDPVDGDEIVVVGWDAGGDDVLRLAWDNDSLFVLGVFTGTYRLGRICIRNQAELFQVMAADDDSFKPVPSRVYPLFSAGEL